MVPSKYFLFSGFFLSFFIVVFYMSTYYILLVLSIACLPSLLWVGIYRIIFRFLDFSLYGFVCSV